MSKIYIDCVDQTLVVREAPRLASGGVNEDTVIFNFCPKWAGHVCTAVFYANDDIKNVYHMALDEENSCKVPWETIADEGWLNIGVFGVKGDVTRTAVMIKLRVSKGAITTETAVSDPTPDVYTQLLNRLYGVYVGSDEPADNSVSLWIDPNGTPSSGSGTGESGVGITSITIERIGYTGGDNTDNTGGECTCAEIKNITITEV